MELLKYAYTQCSSDIPLSDVIMPYLFITNNTVHAIYYGDYPVTGPFSSNTLHHPCPLLLLTQGLIIANIRPTPDTCWDGVIEEFVSDLILDDSKKINYNPKREILIATDGGCKNNGKSNAIGAWSFVIDGYFTQGGPIAPYTLNKLGNPTTTKIPPTNIRGELLAYIEALKLINKLGFTNPVVFLTDSQFLIDVMTKWINNWEKKGELEKKKNPDLLYLMSNLSTKYGRNKISFIHINSHQDSLPHTFPKYIPDKIEDLTLPERRYLNRQVDHLVNEYM